MSRHTYFRDKGVKVDLGIPYELWDKPSVEITNMKTQVCEFFDSFDPSNVLQSKTYCEF